MFSSRMRTEHFQSVVEIDSEPENKRFCLDLQAWQSGYSINPFLNAGSGSIIKLFFTVSPDASPGQETVIDFNGYNQYLPQYFGSIYDFEHLYAPGTGDITVSLEAICGNANADGTVNVSDAVHIINYVFIGGDPPNPISAGDCNCDGSCNVSDAVVVINYVFIGGYAPCDLDGDDVPDC